MIIDIVYIFITKKILYASNMGNKAVCNVAD